jgi:hypothetical protein
MGRSITPRWVTTRPGRSNRIWANGPSGHSLGSASLAWEAKNDIGNYAVIPHWRAPR